MEDIKVSVVMPVYNAEKYIANAIESVYMQTLSDNMEIVVVLDGGSDNTKDIVGKVRERAPSNRSLVLIENETNLGVAESRNIGIRNAKGQYIAFLDADDWWDASKIVKQLELAQKNPEAKIIFTARELYDEKGISLGKVISAPEKTDFKRMLKTNSINCSSAIMRREIASSVKMDHPELAEDYLYWLRILKSGGYAVGLNEPLLKYRVSGKSKGGNKLKAARMHMGCYRQIGMNPVEAAFYFAHYVINGLRKYS